MNHFFVKKIAVLGSGVMGAQIAAQCINAGIETLLFDLASSDKDKNALVNRGISQLEKLKPAPLARSSFSSLLQARNYQEHLTDLRHCDLVIEAISEQLEWKTALYQQIQPFLAERSILVSNTSGLSINTLAQTLNPMYRSHFCGVHFFNPPRYMHLVELIPARETSLELLNQLESWLTRYLGKGVIRAKDTPNFIANRIGIFSLLSTLIHANSFGLTLDEVDLLTGTLIGRPKSATLRTMDVVGLDTMKHVVATMNQLLKDDPWHHYFHLPLWLEELIEQGSLGQKTGQGIYCKAENAINVFDLKSKQYKSMEATISDEMNNIFKIKDPKTRFNSLFSSPDKQALFLTNCYRDLWAYCAYHLEQIAESVRDVDLALRWGFGWEQGPFESWEAAGFNEVKQLIEQPFNTQHLPQLPSWINKIESFYQQEQAYSANSNSYLASSDLPVYQRQLFPEQHQASSLASKSIIFANEGVALWELKNDVAVLSFKSKANTLNAEVLEGIQLSLEKASERCKGVIFYQHDKNNFCSGADLLSLMKLMQQNQLTLVESLVKEVQTTMMKLKYASIPIVAALRGRALGGGCELLFHCSAIVAAFESYPGLVEAGVGLLPAGGGCKELALRASSMAKDSDLIPFIHPFFKQIAMAAVATSAVDAKEMGYFKDKDCWLMHTEEVLFGAYTKINALNDLNYQPPLPLRFRVAGREGHARLQAELINWKEGKFISEHDCFIASLIAKTLCGGLVSEGTWIEEQWILHLEQQAFLELISSPLTQARIDYLLKTGKPLRN